MTFPEHEVQADQHERDAQQLSGAEHVSESFFKSALAHFEVFPKDAHPPDQHQKQAKEVALFVAFVGAPIGVVQDAENSKIA